MPTITQYENVTFTVTGQNPQVKTVQVAFSVDTTTGLGTASTTFTYLGANSGVDTVTASLPSFALTSNPSTVAWQAANGIIAFGDQVSVGSLQAAGQSNGWTLTAPQPFTSTITVSSLYWNHANRHAEPGQFSLVTAQGAFSGSLTPTQFGASDTFQMVWSGYFVVSQAGNITFNWQVDDDVLFGIGASVSGGGGAVSVVSSNPFPNGLYPLSVTPFYGYPLQMISNRHRNGSAPSNSYYATLHFSAPGIYPFEIDYDNTGGAPAQCQLVINGGNNGGSQDQLSLPGTVIPPVPVISVPAAPSPGNGALILTPTGGAANLLLQNQQVTLNLAISGVQFTTQPYIPAFEGNPGLIYIYNDPVNPIFSFLSYNGSTPDGTSAVVNDFTFDGDNTAWQGQISLRYDTVANQFEVYYNGSQSLANNQLFAPNVQATNLTITQEDIAWFNGVSKSYDVFQATSSGGGKFATIPVYYLLNPNYPTGTAVQVSPTTVVADGTQKTFTVTLARPLPPLQNNTVLGVSFSGTQPTLGSVTVTPNFATIGTVSNWLVSYTVTATWPLAASASTSTMLFTFTAPSITYLNGTTFTTATNYAYPFATQPSALITLQASSAPLNPAYEVSFSISPLGLGHFALVATWVSYANNFVDTAFFATIWINGVPQTRSGIATNFSPVVTNIGGGRYQGVFTESNVSVGSGGPPFTITVSFSFVGECSDNSSVSYSDSTQYSL
jgi:hypothetical protein